MTKKYVIINADDFGISDGVCKSILELFTNEAITSTSLMIAAPGAIDRIKKWGSDKLLNVAGVHLQLSGGRPLAPVEKIPSLVEPTSGNFRNPREGAPANPDEVEKEWRLQFETACDILGGVPTHLDTHHGMHRIPELFEVYRKIALEFDIPMRGAVSGIVRDFIKRDALKGTVAIVREWTGRSLDSENLKEQVATTIGSHPDEMVVEIVTHPGYSDSYLESVSSFSSVRENDHSVLLELASQGWWRSAGYKLISYRDFGRGLN